MGIQKIHLRPQNPQKLTFWGSNSEKNDFLSKNQNSGIWLNIGVVPRVAAVNCLSSDPLTQFKKYQLTSCPVCKVNRKKIGLLSLKPFLWSLVHFIKPLLSPLFDLCYKAWLQTICFTKLHKVENNTAKVYTAIEWELAST